ncbi:hypothetical protein [Streptomyces sp. NPDC052225]|uniref:hypothetical protein n=1 Tax=Streptomyces sp. NPDC052225 TaxID=3154949 RepID=UPI0034232D3C
MTDTNPEAGAAAVTAELPEDHRDLIGDLAGIVSDYPSVEPEPALTALAATAQDAFTRGIEERTGHAVLLFATCWYVCHRLAGTGVPAAYTEAANTLSATLAPASCACADGPGSHPGDLDDPEYAVEIGAALLSEAGRAYLAAEYGWEPEETAAYDCPAFLDHLADEVGVAVRPC